MVWWWAVNALPEHRIVAFQPLDILEITEQVRACKFHQFGRVRRLGTKFVELGAFEIDYLFRRGVVAVPSSDAQPVERVAPARCPVYHIGI